MNEKSQLSKDVHAVIKMRITPANQPSQFLVSSKNGTKRILSFH